MAFGLTRHQARLLRFIRGFQLATGYSPCYWEMVAGTDGHRRGIFDLLGALEERGYIRRLRFRQRAIEVIEPIAIPYAPDGAPLYAVPGFGER